MKGLNRIDEHAGDLPGAPADDLERRLMEVLERETVVEVALATQSGLHAVPPSVVGPRKTHDELPAGIEAGQAHRRHDRFGSAHVKRDLVEARHRFELGRVLGDDRVKRPQHRAKRLHALQALGHPLLVARKAGDVDAVRPADIERPVPIEIL